MLLPFIVSLLISSSGMLHEELPSQDQINKKHKAAQAKTIGILRKLGKSTDKLIKRNGSLPKEITTVEILVKTLMEEKLLPESFPCVDGWQSTLIFRKLGGKLFVLKSKGSNLKEEPYHIGKIPEGSYFLDIIWSEGKFLQAPEKQLETKKRRPRKSQQK